MTTKERTLEFMRALWALDHELHRTSKRMAVRLGVTGRQRLVIRLVARQPAITPGELARAMHVHPSTLTGVLARLEQARLLRRSTDPDDRRQTRVELTRAGREIAARERGTVEAAISRALAGTPPADARATRRLLAAITSTLHETAVRESREPS